MRVHRPWLQARFSTGDVVQEVFHSVLKDLSAFVGEEEDAFSGFLAVVVRNRIVDAIRFHQADRRDGRIGQPMEGDRAADDDTANLAARKEERRLLERALESFSERDRLLLRARFEGTESFNTLAKVLGFPNESAARRAFLEAQAKLAIQLSELADDGDDS